MQPENKDELIPRQKLGEIEEYLQLGLDEAIACEQAGVSIEDFRALEKTAPRYYKTLMAQQKKPIIEALRTAVNNLSDPKYATWYLERRAEGFALLKGNQQPVDNSKKEPVMSSEVTPEIIELREKYEAELLAALSKKTPIHAEGVVYTPPSDEIQAMNDIIEENDKNNKDTYIKDLYE